LQLVGSRDQAQQDFYFDASGTIIAGGTAQLLLPQRKSCSHLVIVNNSTGALVVQFGVLPGIATLTGGVVSSVSVPDAGFGFKAAPDIEFLGGGASNDPTTFGATMPGWPAPFNPARGIAVMGTSTLGGLQINSISVTFGGSGYLAPPYVMIRPRRTDPTGVGIPSAAAGIPLTASGGSYSINGTSCPTDAIAIWGATTSQAFACKWLP
jgi:hypothetical protein